MSVYVIDPYFSQSDNTADVTVGKWKRYRTTINEYFFQNINDIDLNYMCRPQNGGTCRTVNETVYILHTRFGDMVILTNGLVNQPPSLAI